MVKNIKAALSAISTYVEHARIHLGQPLENLTLRVQLTVLLAESVITVLRHPPTWLQAPWHLVSAAYLLFRMFLIARTIPAAWKAFLNAWRRWRGPGNGKGAPTSHSDRAPFRQ